jgi:hypothetical protein
MKIAKITVIALIVSLLVITQFAMVSAAPSLDEADSISGTIHSVTVINDESGSVVEIVLIDAETGEQRTVRVSKETAHDLGLMEYDGDGNLVPVGSELWPHSLTIPLDDILPTEEEAHHPVGNALATFFVDLPGVDYNVIMAAHADGYGFGVIAQALWLTQKLEGDAEVLADILEAKETGDFSAFTMEDGTVPTSWGQLRKAIMAGDKKNNLGVVMSNKDKDKTNNGNDGGGGNNGNASNGDNNSNKDKDKDKTNNGNKDNNGNNKP